jgi:hypothetical protein
MPRVPQRPGAPDPNQPDPEAETIDITELVTAHLAAPTREPQSPGRMKMHLAAIAELRAGMRQMELVIEDLDERRMQASAPEVKERLEERAQVFIRVWHRREELLRKHEQALEILYRQDLQPPRK